jgi:hypothetical protein
MFVIAIPLILQTTDSYSRLAIASSGTLGVYFAVIFLCYEVSMLIAVYFTAVFVAFGGLALLIMVPKIVAVEFWEDDDSLSIKRKRTSTVSFFNSEIVVSVRDSSNPIHRGSSPTDDNFRETEIKNVGSSVADYPTSGPEINSVADGGGGSQKTYDKNPIVPGFVNGFVTTVE